MGLNMENHNQINFKRIFMQSDMQTTMVYWFWRLCTYPSNNT